MFSIESVARRWCFILKTLSSTGGAFWTHFIFYSLKRHLIQFHLLQMSQRASLVKQAGKAPEQTSFSEEKVYQLVLTLLLCREAPRGSLSHLYKLEGFCFFFFTSQAILRKIFFFQWRLKVSKGTLLRSIKCLNPDKSLTGFTYRMF